MKSDRSTKSTLNLLLVLAISNHFDFSFIFFFHFAAAYIHRSMKSEIVSEWMKRSLFQFRIWIKSFSLKSIWFFLLHKQLFDFDCDSYFVTKAETGKWILKKITSIVFWNPVGYFVFILFFLFFILHNAVRAIVGFFSVWLERTPCAMDRHVDHSKILIA